MHIRQRLRVEVAAHFYVNKKMRQHPRYIFYVLGVIGGGGGGGSLGCVNMHIPKQIYREYYAKVKLRY